MRVSDFSAYISNFIGLFFTSENSSLNNKSASIPAKEIQPDKDSQEFRRFILEDAFRIQSKVTESSWQHQSPLLFSPLGLLTGMAGCVPVPSPGGPWRSGGVSWVDFSGHNMGTRPTGPDDYEKSTCENPVDVDSLADGENLIITCGDSGRNQIDGLKVPTAGINSVVFPNYLFGDKTKPINLTASAVGPNNKRFTLFEAYGSVEEFENKTRSVDTSGIYVSTAGKGDDIWGLTFDRVEGKYALLSVSATPSVIDGFMPNSPRAIHYSGNKVFVVNSNKVLDSSSGKLTYAPLTVHSYKIDDSLPYLLKKDAFIYLKNGFNPLAMGAKANGPLVILTGGLPGAGIAPTIELIPMDFSQARTSIPIAATTSVDSRPFVPSSFSELPILSERFVLVGSADGSGRIAIVDLDNAKGNSTKLVTVFDGHNIAGVLKGKDDSSAYVLSSSGYVKKVWFDFVNGKVKVGPSYKFGEQFSKNFRIGLYSTGIIVAGPNGYHRIPDHNLSD